jgi:hypothetical protein
MICSKDFPAALQPYLSNCKDILDDCLGVKHTQFTAGVLSDCPMLNWEESAIVQAGVKATKSTIGAKIITYVKSPKDAVAPGDEFHMDFIWPELLSEDYSKFIEDIPKSVLKAILVFEDFDVALVLKRIKESAQACALTPKFFYRCYDKKQHMLDITVRGVTECGWCYCINTAIMLKPLELL